MTSQASSNEMDNHEQKQEMIGVRGLNGKIVIARHKDKGLTVSRLHRYDHTLVLRSENPSYEAVTLSAKERWKIVAKVLWWIGSEP